MPAPRKRGKLRAILLGLLILLCGAVIGAGGTLICVKKILLRSIHHPEEAPARISERIKSSLHLSDEQARRIKAILVERQKALQAIRREAQPRVEKELEITREEVSRVLSPEQARAFRQRFDELKTRWIPGLPPPASEW